MRSIVDPDRLVIYPSRVKLLLVLIGAIGFVVLCAWIAISDATRNVPIWELVLAAYVGVPFFSACGLYAAYRLVLRRPALEIDSRGITDAASGLAVGRLRWEEIDHVVLYEYCGQAMLGIFPRDLEGWLLRRHPLRRSLTRLNLRLGCAPVNIPQVTLPVKLGDLADRLRARHGVRVEGG